MKANELMPGDLITFKYCQNDKEIIVIKIWQINQEGNALVFFDDSKVLDEVTIDEDFAGIPLTPEILEKNGWKSYSRENTLIYGMVQGFEIVLAWMTYYWQLCVDGIIYRKIKIINVHELQHALKLCRIEKTIKL